MSLWFITAAVLPDLTREMALSPFRQAALSSGVQAGFVVGALISAFLGLADRFDPRQVVSRASRGELPLHALRRDLRADEEVRRQLQPG